MSDLSVRPAGAADVALLAAWNAQLIRDEGSRNPMSASELEERMRGWLAGPYRAAIFEAGGEPVAYALFREHPERPHCVHLRQLFVARECRRQGIGRRALERLRREVWPPGATVVLEVLVGNEVGRRFWEALGFRPVSATLELPPA